MIVGLLKRGFQPASVTHLVLVLNDELPKLTDRDRMNTHVKRLRQFHFMFGGFGFDAILCPRTQIRLEAMVDFFGRRAHYELALRNEPELHAERVGDFLLWRLDGFLVDR